MTALHSAAASGRLSSVTEILRANADLNVVSKYGSTPGNLANASGHVACKNAIYVHRLHSLLSQQLAKYASRSKEPGPRAVEAVASYR